MSDKRMLLKSDVVDTPIGRYKKHEVNLICTDCGAAVSIADPASESRCTACGSRRYDCSVTPDSTVDWLAKMMRDRVSG